jgi:hypothetical protein
MRKQSSKTSNRQLEQKKEGDIHQCGRWNINTPLSEHPLGRHFQGGLKIRPDSGLKPWAILCNRFAANNTWLISITASR